MKRPAAILILTCAVLLASPENSPGGTIIHVAKSGDDTYTGQDWETAKLTVQAGLNAAVSGDQVWVAKGTYVECITLKDGVELYGGFVGNETLLTQRTWVT